MIGYIEEVKEDSMIESIEQLAREIWREHYSKIISMDQIEYMLKKYQSKEAIKEQIQSGYEYFLVKNAEGYAGYCSICADSETKKMFLSKIYVKKDSRSMGLGSVLFDCVFDTALSKKCDRIWLTVNRDNKDSISIYKKRGLTITEEVDTPIGEGYLMNDYIMECAVQ